MLKWIYITIIVIGIMFLIVAIASNVFYLDQPMYLGSQTNQVSTWKLLFLIMLVSFIIWVVSTLLVSKFFKSRPKDFDEYDL